jgi:hypothetical protein
MSEFVSEPITPADDRRDTPAMGRGEPGLPAAFRWRDEVHEVVGCVERWKETSAEGGRAGGQVYLRRHCYRLRMADDCIWTVYFTRQANPGSSAKERWFLYTIDNSDAHK